MMVFDGAIAYTVGRKCPRQRIFYGAESVFLTPQLYEQFKRVVGLCVNRGQNQVAAGDVGHSPQTLTGLNKYVRMTTYKTIGHKSEEFLKSFGTAKAGTVFRLNVPLDQIDISEPNRGVELSEPLHTNYQVDDRRKTKPTKRDRRPCRCYNIHHLQCSSPEKLAKRIGQITRGEYAYVGGVL